MTTERAACFSLPRRPLARIMSGLGGAAAVKPDIHRLAMTTDRAAFFSFPRRPLARIMSGLGGAAAVKLGR